METDVRAPETFAACVRQNLQQPFMPETPENNFEPGNAPGRGALQRHELLHLLDEYEDERARGRFRESVYISIIVWMVLILVMLYGPRYLWHAPQLVDPIKVLKDREVVHLDAPVLAPHRVPAPAPKVDTKTLETLRETHPLPPAPAPQPVTPPPTTAAQPIPPTPEPVTPNVPPAPQPVKPAPVVADAPTPQPTKPNFSTPTTARDSIQQAIRSQTGVPSVGGSGTGKTTGHGTSVGDGMEVLSDTQGVDFTEYLRRVKGDIYRNWIPLLPEETYAPILKQGETVVRFKILPDGTIGEMHLDGSTHDDAINRAAWGSVTSEGQFPPLPSKFHGPYLELRFYYYVNEQPR